MWKKQIDTQLSHQKLKVWSINKIDMSMCNIEVKNEENIKVYIC